MPRRNSPINLLRTTATFSAMSSASLDGCRYCGDVWLHHGSQQRDEPCARCNVYPAQIPVCLHQVPQLLVLQHTTRLIQRVSLRVLIRKTKRPGTSGSIATMTTAPASCSQLSRRRYLEEGVALPGGVHGQPDAVLYPPCLHGSGVRLYNWSHPLPQRCHCLLACLCCCRWNLTIKPVAGRAKFFKSGPSTKVYHIDGIPQHKRLHTVNR